jgi:ATP-dependent exoDNAse (exonuclease V) beta subunit
MERHGDDKDPVFELARRLNKAQDNYEKDRLLYVAATRARLRLHLFFGLTVDTEKGIRTPAKGSLLARLWPALVGEVAELQVELVDKVGTVAKPDAWLHPVTKRYQSSWSVPFAPDEYVVPLPATKEGKPRAVTYDWASPVAMHIGVVVHRWLQRIADEGYENWDAERLHALCPQFRRMLAQLETPESELDTGVSLVEAALINAISDDNGQRILSSGHQAAVSELPVTAVFDGRPQSMVIDRTYIDDEGVRWIIDYKTSTHKGGGLETFIEDQIGRYSEQLRGYRDAMQLLEPERKIKTALYFPLLKVFRELELN